MSSMFYAGQTDYITKLNNLYNGWTTANSINMAAINISGGFINNTIIGNITPTTGIFSQLVVKPTSGVAILASTVSNGSLQSSISNNNASLQFGVNGTTDLVGTEYLSLEGFIEGTNGIGISGNGGINTHLHIDTQGNLGLSNPPKSWYNYTGIDVGIWGSVFGYTTQTGISGNAYYDGYTWKYKAPGIATMYQQDSVSNHTWYFAPAAILADTVVDFSTPIMTLDQAANLLIGITTASNTPSSGVTILQNSGQATVNIGHGPSVTMDFNYANFIYNGSSIGSIKQVGTNSVQYLTTSDGRLKYNQEPITEDESAYFIDSLIPKKWTWPDGREDSGFIAHEAQLVAKNSVAGEKFAVDTEGNPIFQSMQAWSPEIIAHMVAEIKSMRKRISNLEA